MSQITRLAQVLQGKARDQDLTTAEIVSTSVRFGGLLGTLLTKAILDNLIAQTHAPMSDNQNVVAGAGLTGGGSAATTTLNVATGDASVVVNADEIHVGRSATGAVGLAVDGISVNVDSSTVEINSNTIRVKDLGITTAKIADNAVDTNKLRSDVSIDANRAVSRNHIRDTAVNEAKLDTSVAGAGLSGGAGSPLSVNVDNSTLELPVDTLQVKDLGITTAKINDNAVTGAKLNDNTAGAGLTRNPSTKALDVVYSPATQLTVVAGETFLANISYLVRWAVNGETAGRVYKANAALARTQAKHLVSGILLSTVLVNAGDSAVVKITGTHTLGSGDTPFAGTDIGKSLYLKRDGSAGFSTTAPTTVDDAQFRIGVIEDTTHIAVDIKDLEAIVPVPTYDEKINYPSGLTANTNITLPVNSRNGGAAQTYSPSAANLKVYVNQLVKFQGADWISIDGSTIQFPFALPNDTEVHFRIDPATSGVLTSSGGGGGSTALQDAYNNGNSITISSGVPVTINGPSGQKLLQINGDIGVSGIVDPIAMQLTPQVGDPFSSTQRGIWLDSSNNLMVKDGPSSNSNITQRVTSLEGGSGATIILKSYLNNTGSLINAFTPVYSPSAGQIAPADGTDASKFRVIGVTMTSISPSASGNVAMFGIVPGVTGLTHNKIIYLGLNPGDKTDVEPTLGPYPAGFHVVKLGVQEGTNLLLQLEQIGTL